MSVKTEFLLIPLVAALIAILIPSIAIAQAMWGGLGWMMNPAYNGYSKATSYYWGIMSAEPWGSGYMGRMVGMGGMVNANYTSITVSGFFIVDKDVEDMEHMAILESNGKRYALILPSEKWIVRSPEGFTSTVDLEDLRETLNTARVTIKGVHLGSMADMMGMIYRIMGGMMSSYGAPMCHSASVQAGSPGATGSMIGGMGMGMHTGMHGRSVGDHEEGEKDHGHMEACMNLMLLPHIVVTEIAFNGYTATPYR